MVCSLLFKKSRVFSRIIFFFFDQKNDSFIPTVFFLIVQYNNIFIITGNVVYKHTPFKNTIVCYSPFFQTFGRIFLTLVFEKLILSISFISITKVVFFKFKISKICGFRTVIYLGLIRLSY